jgi:hypothetical protein
MRLGGVRPTRFAVVTLPAAAAALLFLPAVVLGWVSVSIASAEPISIATSAGSASSVLITPSTDRSITSVRTSGGTRGVALLDVTDGELSDLCVVLRPRIPALDRRLAFRVAVAGAVHLGEITLAVGEGGAGAIDLPQTVIGGVAGSRDVPGVVDPTGFAIRTVSGTARFTDLHTQSLGLVLDDGIRLDALSVRVGGDARC